MSVIKIAAAADQRLVYETGLRAFLSPIASLLTDEKVSEVIIAGVDRIYFEQGGKLQLAENCKFPSPAALTSAVNTIAQFCGKTITENTPIIDGRLPDGSRICIVMPPIGGAEINVNIRKFSRSAASPDFLVSSGSLTTFAKEFLELAVRSKQNIIISGGTGSGKTTLLNALSSWFDPAQRIIVIEDTRELQIQQPHVVSMEARPADAFGKGAVTIRDMFIATLRMRPDRIIVGECRGAEAFDMLQAMNSGHGGTLSTVHADSPLQACGRLEAMSLMANLGLPAEALRRQIALAVNYVVQTNRLPDGRRAVTQISEISYGAASGNYEVIDIFKLSESADSVKLAWTGATPRLKDAIAMYNLRPHITETQSMFAD